MIIATSIKTLLLQKFTKVMSVYGVKMSIQNVENDL